MHNGAQLDHPKQLTYYAECVLASLHGIEVSDIIEPRYETDHREYIEEAQLVERQLIRERGRLGDFPPSIQMPGQESVGR